jgi:hypothetical protein
MWQTLLIGAAGIAALAIFWAISRRLAADDHG